MNIDLTRECIAFAGSRCLARGRLAEVAVAAKAELDARPDATVLLFDDETSEPVEVDFRGDARDVLARLAAAMTAAQAAEGAGERRSPGRPKLGVVAREVTLLPRHWEWLGAQPGGASAALRRLVDQARVANADKDRRRRAQESAYRFMIATLGDQPDLEEAMRAFYADDAARFTALSRRWPKDLRDHARRLAKLALTPRPDSDA